MANSNGAFTLTINTNSGFGETGRPHVENCELAYLLRVVVSAVQAGKPSAAIIDRSGNNVGSYSYGAGMINAGR
jgi:hypothetical protein